MEIKDIVQGKSVRHMTVQETMDMPKKQENSVDIPRENG